MNFPRGNKSPSAWESHKDTILELYHAKSLKEVQKEMRDQHKFHASSSQYQKQFRYWKVRKNRTEEEWKQYFASRDAGSGPTPGELLPVIGRDLQKSSKRAKRWVSMPSHVPHCTGSTLPGTEADPNPTAAPIVPAAPQNIDQADIQSPFSNVVEVFQASGAPSIRNNTRNGNLFTTGGLQGSSQQTIVGATSVSTHWPNFNITSSTGGPFQMTPDFQPLGFGPDSFGLDLLSPIDFPEGSNMALTVPYQDVTFGLDLPFASLEHVLRSDRIVTGNSFFGAIHSGLASRSITAIPPSRGRPIALRPAALQLSLQKLGSVIPGESFSLITNSQAFETNFVRMLSFSILNGFAGFNDVPMEDILRFLNRFAGKLFLDILEQCPPHVSRTLSDNVFRAAIEATDDRLVKLLLERGLVDANETVCFHKGHKCTPIERAAFLGSLDLIHSLLDGHADVDRTYTEGRGYGGLGGGALAMLVYSISRASNQGRLTIQPQLVEVFHQLISAGARARPEFLKFASGNGMRDLFTLLAPNVRPESHHTFFKKARNGLPQRDGFLSQVAKVMDDQGATTWFRDTFGHCNRLCNNECITNGIELLHHVALDAARAGKAGLVKLLVEEARIDPRAPEIFTAAVSSQNYDLVEFVLGFGPDLDPPAVNIFPGEQSSLEYRTPIAEAVRQANKGLARMLEAGGSLDHLNEGGRFGPLLIAAAEAGDKDFVNKLLRQTVTWRREEREGPFALALLSAAEGGYREIVRVLLQAGAARCGFNQRSTHSKAMKAAARRQDMQMMRDLIEFQVQAEYDWDASGVFDDISAIECSFMKMVVEEYPETLLKWKSMQKFLGQCIKTDNILLFKTLLQTLVTDSLLLDACLETAIESRHSELVEYLIDLGANPFNRRVIERVVPDRPDLLRTLLKQDRSRKTIPTCIGSNALKSVIGDGEGDSEALNLLIETQAINFTRLEMTDTYFPPGNVERVVYLGDALTPLGLAILGSSERPGTNLTAMEKFLQAGADPNGIARARGEDSKCPPLTTALVLAVGTSREDAVKMLLSHGALVDARPRLGTTRTALQHAAETGNASMVKLLLDHHANADDTAPACGGATALQFAAMSGNLNIAEDLLQHGSKLEALPSQIEGRWPLEGAAEAGRLDMISFLWKLYLQSSQFGEPCAGFSDRQCLRSMDFARLNGHIGCVKLISDLTGISIDRLETDNYGETWVTYETDYA